MKKRRRSKTSKGTPFQIKLADFLMKQQEIDQRLDQLTQTDIKSFDQLLELFDILRRRDELESAFKIDWERKLKKFGHGELVTLLTDLVREVQLVVGQTPPSAKIGKIERILRQRGYDANFESIRKKLNNLGYYDKKKAEKREMKDHQESRNVPNALTY